jgi:hypothetical protein
MVDRAGAAVELPGADTAASDGDADSDFTDRVEQHAAVPVVDVAVPGGVVALQRRVFVGQQVDLVIRQALRGE